MATISKSKKASKKHVVKGKTPVRRKKVSKKAARPVQEGVDIVGKLYTAAVEGWVTPRLKFYKDTAHLMGARLLYGVSDREAAEVMKHRETELKYDLVT